MYLSGIVTVARQFLRDEFAEGKDLVWKDNELRLHIGHCLREISRFLPYETKETLTTTAKSRDLDLSTIAGLLKVKGVIKVEYKVGNDPPDFRNCTRWGNTLTIDTTLIPAAGEDVYLWCRKLHELSESSSTLDPIAEELLIDAVVAYAAISKARELINKVNIGGGRTPAQMLVWGRDKLAIFKAELRGEAEPTVEIEYPKD